MYICIYNEMWNFSLMMGNVCGNEDYVIIVLVFY